jgi:hypothetical protein
MLRKPCSLPAAVADLVLVRRMAISENEMKSILEERTKHWRDLSDKHFKGIPDLSLIVLKGHLLLEQFLTALILHYARPSADLGQARLSFGQKVALAKAFVIFPIPSEFWGLLTVLNQLRNDFAHELEPQRLEEHLKVVRKMAAAHRKTTEKKFLSMFDTDEGMLKMIISYWLGYLTPLDSLIHVMEKSKKYA